MTQQESKGIVRIFSARACAEPLVKAAKLYEEKTGVGLLSFAKQPELAEKFMDFLASGESRQFYKEYGWEITED